MASILEGAACSKQASAEGCESRGAGPGVNVGNIERAASVLAGGGLALLGLRHIDSLGGLAATLIGGGLVYRGVSGHCTAYSMLGISTARPNSAEPMTSTPLIDPVEEASDESFPASDPPSWTTSVASETPRDRGK